MKVRMYENDMYAHNSGDGRDPNGFYVCGYCLQAIESHEDKQKTNVYYCDEEDEKDSRCDWCKDSGFDTLYLIKKSRRR